MFLIRWFCYFRRRKPIIPLLFIGSTSILVTFVCFYSSSIDNLPTITSKQPSILMGAKRFVVKNSKCGIPDLDPFHEDSDKYFEPGEYLPCRSLELLTYIRKSADNRNVLHLNWTAAKTYTNYDVVCCYKKIRRGESASSPDDIVEISESCKTFRDNVTLDVDTEFLLVTCWYGFFGKIYENIHAVVTVKPPVQEKLERNSEAPNNRISVFLVGIDSVSRLNVIRTMPKTYAYLEDHGWVDLKGYNKVGYNTYPNLMAAFTGFEKDKASDICKPTTVGGMDECTLIWKEYRKRGYVTVYAEDETVLSTFNFQKKGFTKPPADYYYRPYIAACEKLLPVVKLCGMDYCTGPETTAERILNVAVDFTETFRNQSKFAFFWMNSFSHDCLNTPSGMDERIVEFLVKMGALGTYEEAIFILLSDHGMRFGEFRFTPGGWLEDRLPFIYLHVPESFKRNFPQEYHNLLAAQHKLTDAYDLYMTLQHILVLSGLNYTLQPAPSCPKCASLFSDINPERNCKDIGIPDEYCTCLKYEQFQKLNDRDIQNAALVVISAVQRILEGKGVSSKCARYTLKRVLSEQLLEQQNTTQSSLLMIKIETTPTAMFEARISLRIVNNNTMYTVKGNIDRIDRFGTMGRCVEDTFLERYCQCI